MTIDERLAAVNERIAAACERAGRSPASVTLVAVAKSFPADAVTAAARAGAFDIGENRAQELIQKSAVIPDGMVRWHFVGPLQTNKARRVVGIAALIHSIDRIGLAEAVARRAASLGIRQDVLIEVNIAGETSKAGVDPARVVDFAEEVAAFDVLTVKGLMAIPPLGAPEAARLHFEELAGLGEMVAGKVPGADHLSMGMSRDFEVAIEAGATIIRIGEAIFGSRNR